MSTPIPVSASDQTKLKQVFNSYAEQEHGRRQNLANFTNMFTPTEIIDEGQIKDLYKWSTRILLAQNFNGSYDKNSKSIEFRGFIEIILPELSKRVKKPVKEIVDTILARC
ncbi:hypothetical protein SNEBB_004770 [Seison nebaliae]|nr:hypothetical protein SNEBB_004770 [Seison nebaliae]